MNENHGSLPNDTYTVKEVANMLNLSIRKVYYLCKTSTEFKVFRLGDNVRIHKGSFDKWFNAGVE